MDQRHGQAIAEQKPAGDRLKYALGLVLVLLLVMLGVAAVLPAGLWLTVTPVQGGQPLISLRLTPGARFTLRYNHSVEGTPIWETHSVDAQGRIYVEEERYLKFGAGMGKMPGVGRMVRQGDYEVIQDMHRPTGNFVLRIGSPGVDHTLIWCDGEINLTALAPHRAVRFCARPINLLQSLTLRRLQQPGRG